MKNVVIVGGGAGGIELATFLGDKLGRKEQAKAIVHTGKTITSALNKVRSRASIVNRNMLNSPLFMGKKAICSWLLVVFLMIT